MSTKRTAEEANNLGMKETGDPETADVLNRIHTTTQASPSKRRKSISSPDDSEPEALPLSPRALRMRCHELKSESKSSDSVKGLDSAFEAPRTGGSTENQNDATVESGASDVQMSDPQDIKHSVRNQQKVTGTQTGAATPQTSKPVNLDNLPQVVLKKILKHVFPVEDTVMPWFNCGISILGIRGFRYNDEGVTFKPNIDTAFLRVTKACYQAGTDILYGSNHFRFTKRADCCKWWIHRIGDANIKKIKMMTFILVTGWLDDHRDPKVIPTVFENSFEFDWAACLHHINKCRPSLQYLNITTMYWTDMLDEPRYSDQDKDEINQYRKTIVQILAKFRGIKRVDFVQVGTQWVGREAQNLKLLMAQPEHTRFAEPEAQQLTWRETLRRVRMQRTEQTRRLMEHRRALMAGLGGSSVADAGSGPPPTM